MGTATRYHTAGGVIPDPWHSDEQEQRFHHRDLHHLSPEQIWAEKVLVTEALAQLIFERKRPRLIWASVIDEVTEEGWLRERLRRLKSIGRAA